MNEELLLTLSSDAVKTIIMIAGPLLVGAMAVGILVSILQAVTQINESTLTFIPKMVAVLVILTVMAPWMLEVLQQYTVDVLGSVGNVIH